MPDQHLLCLTIYSSGLHNCMERCPCHFLTDIESVHMIVYGLQAASNRSAALLQLLEREYRPSLSRDGELLAMLEVVKQKHFGMQRAGLGGLLGSLFQNLGSDPAIASA